MREKWARRIALLTGLLVILLAVIFSLIQNPIEHFSQTENRQQTSSTQQEKPVDLDAKKIENGKQIYQQQTCARCHSIAGKGNPRNPVDGVGEKYNAEELYNRITGDDSLQDELPAYILKLKQNYRKLPDEDLESLINYMQSLQR